MTDADDLEDVDPDMPARLTPRQERFCIEYPKDFNATQAAIRAGYGPRTASQTASRLLRFVKVAERLKLAMDELAQAAKNDTEDVLKEIGKIAFLDLGKAFNAKGELLPLKDMPEEVRRALSGVDVAEITAGAPGEQVVIGHTTKIKLLDKLRALELLGKAQRLFVDRVEHEGKVTLEDLVQGSRDPSEGGAR